MGHFSKISFSSKDEAWRTPRYVFDFFDGIYNFDLDAAASQRNHLCPRYFTKRMDALTVSWADSGSRIWLNPPYSRKLGHWMRKCKMEARKGVLVGALIFVRSDTRWWHDHVMTEADHVYLIKGRLKFGDSRKGHTSNAAPTPSCFVVWQRQLGLFRQSEPSGPRFSAIEIPKPL